LELTNELLRRLKEPELTESTFASARGTQATAKDCIKASVSEIYARDFTLPPIRSRVSINIVPGQIVYELTGLNAGVINWDSARIRKNETFGINTSTLEPISTKEWYTKLRPADEDAGDTGIGLPRYIFDASYDGDVSYDLDHNSVWVGISPSPDKEYLLDIDCTMINYSLMFFDDMVALPNYFDWVIILGALKTFYMFKDNSEQANIISNEFNKGLGIMRAQLNSHRDDMRSTVVNFGNNRKNSFYVR
jgi:hypothetical protein